MTANARYSHASLSLRCLIAALGPPASRTVLLEAVLEEKPSDLAERILRCGAKVVLFSVHIWNTELLTETAALLRRLRPDLRLVAGGPEVSHNPASHPIFEWVDHMVCGEGEETVGPLTEALLSGKDAFQKIIVAPPADLSAVPLPYDLYTDEDLRHRVLYMETSRGCPLGCEFCLSSLDTKVRCYPEEKIIQALETLWQRGARQFKFIDRALHLGATDALFDFFEPRANDGLFLHFELIPDRLSARLLNRLRAFPKGAVQVEAGIQTLNEAVSARISRKQNNEKALATLRTLRETTGVHIHADLVIGLPGENLESFAAGFDTLYRLGLHEIQVGILKRLRGAPIARHDAEWKMVYNPRPPYDILETADIDFETMQSLKRFAKFFDLVCNRGNFRALVPRLIGDASPFAQLSRLSARLYEQTGRTHGIALGRLASLLETYAVEVAGIPAEEAADLMLESFRLAGRGTGRRGTVSPGPSRLPSRQNRHL